MSKSLVLLLLFLPCLYSQDSCDHDNCQPEKLAKTLANKDCKNGHDNSHCHDKKSESYSMAKEIFPTTRTQSRSFSSIVTGNLKEQDYKEPPDNKDRERQNPSKEEINKKIKELNKIYHANPTESNYHNLMNAKKQKYNPNNIPEEEIGMMDMQQEDIHRLIASFVFCIIGTLAADGNMFWTLILFLYMILMGLWWASDKQQELTEHFTKKYNAKNNPNERQRGQYHYKINPGQP